MPATLCPTHEDALELREQCVRRFVEAAQQRADTHPTFGRRSSKRHSRSWPLAVGFQQRDRDLHETAALHNASLQGIAFLFRYRLEAGATISVHLFSLETDTEPVPAVVRHVTPTRNGYLVGCEFIMG